MHPWILNLSIIFNFFLFKRHLGSDRARKKTVWTVSRKVFCCGQRTWDWKNTANVCVHVQHSRVIKIRSNVVQYKTVAKSAHRRLERVSHHGFVHNFTPQFSHTNVFASIVSHGHFHTNALHSLDPTTAERISRPPSAHQKTLHRDSVHLLVGAGRF